MKDIYSDADFYDNVNTQTGDINFFLKYAQQIGGPILELAAGTGRIAVPLLENGFQYVGIDLSPEFVDRANSKISRFTDLGRISVGDMRNFNLQQKFNLIFIGFNSIFHLMNENEIKSCLTCVYKHLSKNGKFLIDMFVPNKKVLFRDYNKFYPVGEYKDNGGKTVVVKEKNKYDPQTEINHITWFAYYEGEAEPDIFDYYLYMILPERSQRLLKDTGFIIKNIFGDYDENPFNENSKLQIYICRR